MAESLEQRASKKLTVGGCAIAQTPLAFDSNADAIIAAIDSARSAGVEFLVFPELTISGYGCEDAFYSPFVAERSLNALAKILPHTSNIAVAVGLPLRIAHDLFNVVAVVADGVLRGFTAKHSLAGEDVYYEPRWFRSWPLGTVQSVNFFGEQIPVGDLLFDINGATVGFEICEDAWNSPRRGTQYSSYCLDLIVNPSASHFFLNKYPRQKALVLEATKTLSSSYLYVNHLGNEAGRVIYDGNTIVGLNGAIVAEGRRFSFERKHLSVVTLDLPARAGAPIPADQKIEIRLQPHTSHPHVAAPALDRWEQSSEIEFEEFTRAVALGLFHYMEKSRSHGFVVSVSGGADSTAVYLLSALSLRMAFEELGKDGVVSRLKYIPGIESITSAADLVKRLLLGVYQATAQSSETTYEAAKSITRGIGGEFLRFNIEPLVRGYKSLIEASQGFAGLPQTLNWKDHDFALQNIQARVRSPSIWFVANLRKALLLCTSNRSEASVGYSTMDGDTSGGISPIAGIDKSFLRKWLRWMESVGPEGIGAYPFLRAVNVLEPTAELKPAEFDQLDEKDLMPYDLLQEIESLFLLERLSPEEVLAEVLQRRHFHDHLRIREAVERFFTLFQASQWKRERFAPSFHLDEYSVDPKSWLRWPILSGALKEQKS